MPDLETVHYMPSIKLTEQMAERDLHPFVKVVRRKKSRTKDVTYRLQKTRKRGGASVEMTGIGTPDDFLIAQEDVDEIWQGMIKQLTGPIFTGEDGETDEDEDEET